MSINKKDPSENAWLETHQAADLVKHLNGKGLTGLTAIRILKIAAFSIELNVSDAERIARFESEVNKP